MNKKRQRIRRLLALALCAIVTITNTIPSAGVRVSASEPETAQEDFFEPETYSGGVLKI